MTEDQIRSLVVDLLNEAVARIGSDFADMRQHVDRRINDLIVDMTHTFEQVDDTESRLARRFDASAQVLQDTMADAVRRLASITNMETGDTTASSGVELELAVKATEESADRILSAAERLSTHAALLARSEDPESRAIAQAITDDVAAIFEASSFHDLAGQRVRGAIRLLEEVRAAIASTAGLEAAAPKAPGPAPASMGGKAVSQSDIDALFG
jgi:hypothetical protein